MTTHPKSLTDKKKGKGPAVAHWFIADSSLRTERMKLDLFSSDLESKTFSATLKFILAWSLYLISLTINIYTVDIVKWLETAIYSDLDYDSVHFRKLSHLFSPCFLVLQSSKRWINYRRGNKYYKNNREKSWIPLLEDHNIFH